MDLDRQVLRLARMSPYRGRWDWDAQPRASYEFSVAVLDAPEVVSTRPFKTRERVVWNLAAVIKQVVLPPLWPRSWQAEIRASESVEVLRLCPRFLHQVYLDDVWSESAYMWWDGIVGRPDPREYGEIGDALFEVMVEQLGIPHRISKFSGLHGLNHLQDPRTRRVVDEFQMAHKETDRELYEYCMYVKRFEAL